MIAAAETCPAQESGRSLAVLLTDGRLTLGNHHREPQRPSVSAVSPLNRSGRRGLSHSGGAVAPRLRLPWLSGGLYGNRLHAAPPRSSALHVGDTDGPAPR